MSAAKMVADGKITINASGGIKPYLYSLDSVNYTSNNVFENLKRRHYTCGVKIRETASLRILYYQ
jgi:hypothetical protein